MQPYFMPYIGYFQLINAVDEFILFDTPQFIRHGWIERNNILKINGDSIYIKVPLVKHERSTAILDIKINNSINWEEKILAQITHYKKKAPYYNEVTTLLNYSFEFKTESIVKLNYYALKTICDYLNITTPIKIWSEMKVEIESANAPDEWALNICKALKADTYYNPEGGLSFFDRSKYKNENIEIKFLRSTEIEYNQFSNNFVPFLSIIDLLMFCSKNEVISMMDKFKIID